ncbi:unnamed protein product [Rhizoctonia solani]|nr:unnamed protein product [Rhizoctonia solani]
MSRQPTHAMTSHDQNWPKLGTGKQSVPPAPSKAGPARVQPVCAVDQSPFSKSLGGVGERLSSGAVNHTPDARPTYPRLALKTTEPDTRTISFRDMVRRGSPPPSPTSLQSVLSLPLVDTPTDTLKRPHKPSTQVVDTKTTRLDTVDLGRLNRHSTVAADNFPPLSPIHSSFPAVNKDKSVPVRKNSYAAATGSSSSAKTRPTVTTGACAISTCVSESPVSVLGPGSTAKVISLNIGSVPVPDVRPATPLAQSHSRMQTPKRRGTSAPSNTLSPPQFEGRNRSASVSSVATSVATSVITTSSRGPASSKTSVCHTPICDDTEWQPKLAALAQALSGRDRLAWEKILRCDPKDTSKMKWNTFDKALKALKFKSQARGGSETEYTPDPDYFGAKAQPISYHRPHPGADFTLGDLKAKSNSFRQQYAIAVAVLHGAWGLVDTRQ